MQKIPTGCIEFKGKHRVRFEAVVEYNENGYPEGVVFAEIHKDLKQEEVIRMQLRHEDLWELAEAAREIQAISDAIIVTNQKQPIKKLGKYAKYTQSHAGKSMLYFGVSKGEITLFYLNFTRTKKKGEEEFKETLNISLAPLSLQAFIQRMTFFAKESERAYFMLYADKNKGVPSET